MKWNQHTPAPRDRKIIAMFSSGIVATVRYREGTMGEPSRGVIDYRCDCCGRFATPVAWAELKDIES